MNHILISNIITQYENLFPNTHLWKKKKEKIILKIIFATKLDFDINFIYLLLYWM